jgi:hypothetical protein
MSNEYYENSGPREQISLTDEGRPSVIWIFTEKAREDYVNDCLKWTFDDIWEHYDILKLEKGNDPLWSNCLKNLGIALRLKEESDNEYMEFLKAHLYENFDLSH